LVVGAIACWVLPSITLERTANSPWQQMSEILSHPIHRRAFALSGMLVFGGGLIIPFMAPTMVANVGLSESQLPLIYLFGGACTFFTMPVLGWLSDRLDKLHVLAGITVVTVIAVIVLTNLSPMPLPALLAITSFFFVGMSGRFAPAMAMVTNAVESRYRGGFMSVSSSLQQLCGGIANLIVGVLVTENALNGRIEGYPRAGWLAVGAFLATVWLAARLRRIAPHAARNPTPAPAPPARPQPATAADGS
jgi:predicted MFS family arabinose efflux permease